MDAIAQLKLEHAEIGAVLSALDRYCQRLANGEPEAGEALTLFVRFFRMGLEDRHFAKEEDELFPMLASQGFSKDEGPIASLLADHEDCRQLLTALHAQARNADPWDEQARRRVVATSRALIDLLREHMQKEDNVLYPTVAAHLPAEERAVLERRCDELDRRLAVDQAYLETELLRKELIASYRVRTNGS